MYRVLYSNDEILPTKDRPQIHFSLHYPTIDRWYIYLGTSIGIEKQPPEATYFYRNYNLIILGFGISLEYNWD